MEALDGLFTWVAAGVASGVTLVGSAAVLDPTGDDLAKMLSVAPDGWMSALALMVFTAMRVVRDSGERTATVHKDTLVGQITALATEGRDSKLEMVREIAKVHVDIIDRFGVIGERIGVLSSDVGHVKTGQLALDVKVDRLEDRMASVEGNCAAITRSGGHA